MESDAHEYTNFLTDEFLKYHNGIHETRNISDRNRRFGASCAIIKVSEKAKLKRICIKACQANYMNTLARRESDCTFNAGLKIFNTQHFINKAVKFARAFLDYIEAF